MDKETLKYIITYYSNLMTTDEKLQLKHKIFIPENDYEEFEINIANRLMKESSQKVFFNNCPQCENWHVHLLQSNVNIVVTVGIQFLFNL